MKPISLEKAYALIQKEIRPLNGIESVPLDTANLRVLGKDVISPLSIPPFDRSPLDGYALRSVDTVGISADHGRFFRCIDTVFAGSYSDRMLKPHECIRIMTGAEMPKGADCVIKHEVVEEQIDGMTLYQSLQAHENYIFKGEDIKEGTLLMKSGTLLTYAHLATLSSLGFQNVDVRLSPKIALLNTGDEIIAPGQSLPRGKIYDSNIMLFRQRLKNLGFEHVTVRHAEDCEDALQSALDALSKDHDLIITIGGVSAGDKDLIPDQVRERGAKVIFQRVDVKPGSPVMLSLLDQTVCLSLSGNPYAAFATFELIGRTVLATLTDCPALQLRRETGRLARDLLSPNKKRRFVRGIECSGALDLLDKNQSGTLSSLMDANVLIEIPENDRGMTAGEEVAYYRL